MVRVRYRYARRKLGALLPRTRLGRFTLYLLGVTVFLYLLEQALLRLAPQASRTALDAWIRLLSFALGVLGVLLLLRWIRQRFMWRLRNRLIVTYTFVGVIPLLLVLVMVLIGGYLFAGQFATYLVTSDLQAELKSLQAANSTMAAETAARLQRRARSAKPLPPLQGFRPDDPRLARTEIVAWYQGEAIELHRPAAHAGGPTPRPAWVQDEFGGVAVEDETLSLRVLNTVPLGADKLTVISSMPLDRELLQRLAGDHARITVYLTNTLRLGEQPRRGAFGIPEGVVFEVGNGPQPQPRKVTSVAGGTLQPQTLLLDRELAFAAPFSVFNWRTGEKSEFILQVTTRPSMLYSQLFVNMVDFGGIFQAVLIAMGISFAVIELLAWLIGIGLTRTITRSVAELYNATGHINRGNLRHRIAIKSRDQLAALESSFNSMTESLEKLIAEQKEKQRLENELAIAQEVQAQLFPHAICDLETLEVHGVCRPARTVSGDYYDFLPFGPDRLAIAVGDISGKGISAALLMATLHSAVRAYAYGRSPVPTPHLVAAGFADNALATALEPNSAPNGYSLAPAEVLALLNRHLYRSTPPEKYATLFFSVYDGRSRTLSYSNAGHLPPMVIGQDGAIRRLDTPGLVVGLFDEQSYEDRTIELHPGEVFLAFSDGITEPENEFGEFGEERLIEIVQSNRDLPLARVSDLVTAAVSDWIGGAEQPDDVTLVLARAK
ncbi:MAG TPA: SpoIIE family protein phosphatase [Terriglobales bacterium]|nr:SpoIIE family protein phosphatase [Terriglobales bacterium]